MIVYPSGEEEFTIPGMFSALRTLIDSKGKTITPGDISGTPRSERSDEEDAK
jgi:hypothetical protein